MRTTLEEWMEIIPIADHSLAEAAWQSGAFRFAKHPVTQGRGVSTPAANKAAGPPRPLLCPEPPPYGCDFQLVWDCGSGWIEMSLHDMVVVLFSTDIENARQIHMASLRTMEAATSDNHRLQDHQVAQIRKALEGAEKLGASVDAVALAFMAGIQFSHCTMMLAHRSTLRQGALFTPGKTSPDADWYNIIGAAIERHGNVTATALLNILGGERKFDGQCEAALSFEPSEVHWNFCLNSLLPPIDWTKFSKIVKKSKRRLLA